jgi:D-alanyl-D-alanine carboxypeptidase (penicillin-binding protein 5/6)
VILGTDSDAARARETQKLLSYGFRHYDTKTIFSAGDTIKENAKVWYGEQEFLNLTIRDDVTLTLPRGTEKQLSANILIDEQIKAPISAGQELGRLQVSLNDQLMIDTPLVAEQDVTESGFFARFVDWIVLFITRLMS